MVDSEDCTPLEELLGDMRPAIFAHCYRFLGCIEEAEDLTQESLLKMTTGYDAFEGRSSFRTWAYRIATNTCYNYLQTARRRREVVVPDPLLTADEYLESVDPAANMDELQESLEFSFICVLQELSPLQRLVVVLRDVLGWSVQETAEALGSAAGPIKNVHSRARRRLKTLRARGKRLPAAHPEAQRFMEAFARAHVEDDVDTCLGFHDAKSVLYQFPTRKYVGRREIAEFYEIMQGNAPTLFIGVKMNGTLGAACYHPTDGEQLQQTGVIIVELRKPRLPVGSPHVSTAFWALEPEQFKRAALPDRIDSAGHAAEVGRLL